MQKLTIEQQKQLLNQIQHDLRRETIDPVTKKISYGNLGQRYPNETNIIDYRNYKIERYMPYKVEDMELLQAEKAYEHNILKYITKDSYEHRCETNENCKYKSLYCDKLEPEDKYGQCEVKKKINMIGSECDKDNDCISNVCKNRMCRLNYDEDIRTKLNFIN